MTISTTTPTTTRLGNINLFVLDIASSARFYIDGLGLTLDDARSHPPHFTLLQANGVTITLQDQTAPESAFGIATNIELGFEVADIDAMRQQLKAAGAQVEDAQQMGWGGGFNAVSPDGHRLTIYRMAEYDA